MRSLSATSLFFMSAVIGFIIPFGLHLLVLATGYNQAIISVLTAIAKVSMAINVIAAALFVWGVVVWKRGFSN